MQISKKEARNKITLCTNKDPITLNKIFSDLTDNFSDSHQIKANPNMNAFAYPNRATVSIIISKQAGRYRIQSHQYEALLFITNQIIIRLSEIFQYDIQFYIEDDIHVTEYFNIIENHFKYFAVKKNKNEDLHKYASLYTIVQKNLLNKYKEKNPPSLNNLDFLLKHVYKAINKQSDEINKINLDAKINTRDLIIWTENILFFIKLRYLSNK